MIEIVPPTKKIFAEETQAYTHEFKNKILDLDADLPNFGEQLDGLISTNKLLQEMAIKANFDVPNSPFGEIIHRFEDSIQLLRDRHSKVDWIIKGLFIEVVNMINHFNNEYYLETTSDEDVMASVNHLFTQINDHLLQSEEFTLLKIPESSYKESEPFNLDETTEALHLFDVDDAPEMSTELYRNTSDETESLDGFLMIQLEQEDQIATPSEIFKDVTDNASDELTTLFPSLLIEPFTGDLDDFLDNAPSNNDHEEKLPMPELLVDIFSESSTDQILGSDDETELQGVIWHDQEEELGFVEEDFSPAETAFTISKSLDNVDDSTDSGKNDDSILEQSAWQEIDSVDNDSVLEQSAWQAAETSFSLSKHDLISDNITSDEFFTSREEENIFENPLIANQNLPSETSSMLSYASLDSDLTLAEMLDDFSHSDIDTELEESPIYQNKTRVTPEDASHNPSISLENQEIDDLELSGLSLDPNYNLNLNLGINNVAKQSSSQLATTTENDAIIRIPVNHLEMLGDLSEELLVRKGSLDIYLGELKLLSGEASKHLQLLEPNSVIQNQNAIANLQNTIEQMNNVLERTEQHTYAMSQDVRHLRTNLRQVLKHPISSLVRKFPRILRDLSLTYGKQVELIVQGAEIEVERLISEIIAEPLELLLRNAFEYGIENLDTRQQQGKVSQGKIEFIATQTEENIVIKVIDDGCGIDIEKIRNQVEQSAAIAGMSGFSTMDMSDEQLIGLIFEPSYSMSTSFSKSSNRLSDVKKKLREIGGTISVQSKRGEGTQFTMVLPNILSLMRVLLIDIEQMCLAIPSKVIMEVLPIDSKNFHQNQETLVWRDRLIPIVRLNSLLKLNCRHSVNPEPAQSNSSVQSASQSKSDKPTNTIPAFLVISYESDLFALETDGCWNDQEATFHQIEGDISLPQIFLGTVILGSNQAVALLNPTEIVNQCLRSTVSNPLSFTQNVHTSFDNLSSLSDFFEAEDISPDLSRPTSLVPPTERSPESKHLQNAGQFPSNLGNKQAGRSHQSRILIVESSANVRRYLAMALTKSGFLTEQVQDSKEALSFLKECLAINLNVDVVITDLEMPQMDGFKLLSSIRAEVDFQNLPIVVLTAKNNENDQKLALELGANAYFSKPYREQELISKLHQIISG